MEGTRGGSELPAYEQSRLASIAENKRKLGALVEIKRKYLALGENMRPSEEVGGSSQPAKKKVYSELSLLHVAGIKSYARSRHELANELGYDLQRDEIFIIAHTRKTGVPTAQAETLIVKSHKHPEEAAELHPELKEKPIQEGDIRAHVFGEKEPRGGVRKLCQGPTPQNVGTHGTKAKLPTKLAMEIQFRRQDEQVSTLLERTEQMQ